MIFNRRSILLGGTAAYWGTLRPGLAVGAAQDAHYSLPIGRRKEIESLFSEARRLQIRPVEAAADRTPDFLDIAELIARANDRYKESEVLSFSRRAGLILGDANKKVRDGLDPSGVQFDPDQPESAAVSKYTFDRCKSEYRRLFQTAHVSERNKNLVNKVARLINSKSFKEMYQEVQSDTGIPWYVVGAIHYRETSLNFMGHLHNGNNLYHKTTWVPKGRPKGKWPPNGIDDPRTLWRLSAKDALDGMARLTKTWTVERMLWTFERFNGFGCRSHGIHSPYLWNYTQHYTRGGFPKDRVFDKNYLSKQSGLAAIIIRLNQIAPAEVALKYD